MEKIYYKTKKEAEEVSRKGDKIYYVAGVGYYVIKRRKKRKEESSQ